MHYPYPARSSTGRGVLFILIIMWELKYPEMISSQGSGVLCNLEGSGGRPRSFIFATDLKTPRIDAETRGVH